MSSILEHYTANEVQSISVLIPLWNVENLSENRTVIQADSLEYFNQVFIISDHPIINPTSDRSVNLSMRQIVRKAVQLLLTSPKTKFCKSTNVLCFGFQKTKNGNIESQFPNNLNGYLFHEPWSDLLNLVGDDFMLYLLSSCSIFIGTTNLLQISGIPLSERSTVSVTSSVPSYQDSKNMPILNRLKIMYGRPLSYKIEDGNVVTCNGLSLKHVLNDKTCDVVNLTKNIFFSQDFSNASTNNWQWKILLDFTLEMLANHRKCPYTELYKYYTRTTSTKDRESLQLYRVQAFCYAAISRIIPKTFRESTFFVRHIKLKIGIFLKRTRFEKMSTKDLLRGLQLRGCLSLFDPKAVNSSGHCRSFQSTDELRKIEKLCSNFLFFIFEHILIDLLRYNFYITESAAIRTKLLFFRHDSWLKLTAPTLEEFQGNMFDPVIDNSNKNNLPLWRGKKLVPLARCRLVPKGNGKYRPIMSFYKPTAKDNEFRLRSSFDVLKHVYEIDKSLSLIGFSSLQSRLLAYKSSAPPGPFFMAKLDISRCFDSIPHDKLFAVLEKLLKGKEFQLRRVDQLHLDFISNRPVNRRRLLSNEYSHNLKNKTNSSVTIDRISGKYHEGSEVLNIIREHVSHNIVKINGKLFRQKKGIPQGSYLSTLLCSLFYSEFDRESGILQFPQDDLIMRYADDFLIISPSQERIVRLYNFLQEGSAEFGMEFNPSKTRFNFNPLNGQFHSTETDSSFFFSWCGIEINRDNLDVRADYSNFASNDISHFLTREFCKHPGKALLRQMQYFLRPKLRKLFHCGNSHSTIIFNLANSFTMTAIKTHSYLREFERGNKTSSLMITSDFLIKCLQNLIVYCCKLVVQLKGYPNMIKSIAYNTFYNIFKIKNCKYQKDKKLKFWLFLKKTALEEFPLPNDCKEIVEEVTQKFFKSIKY